MSSGQGMTLRRYFEASQADGLAGWRLEAETVGRSRLIQLTNCGTVSIFFCMIG